MKGTSTSGAQPRLDGLTGVAEARHPPILRTPQPRRARCSSPDIASVGIRGRLPLACAPPSMRPVREDG
jgi:hypothetical protein